MSDEQEQPATLNAAMAIHGLTIKAEFIPFSTSRNKAEKSPNLNWRVTLQSCRATEYARDLLTTEYSAGAAHAPSYSTKNKFERETLVAWECEHGKAASHYADGLNRVIARTPAKPIEPDAASVLHSLLMDSDVLDFGGFESWAREFGYDANSRKAESIYRACLDIALKLRNGLGETVLTELHRAAEGF